MPLFPDAGRDNLMSFLNSQSQDSSISSKENNGGSITAQRSFFSAPDIRNTKSISSSVHHHSYDPRMYKGDPNLARSSQDVKTQTHSMKIPNSYSSSVQHHRYEPSVISRENQRVRDKENDWDAHYRTEMPDIQERVNSSKNDSRKHQHSNKDHHAHQMPILSREDFAMYGDIASVPSNETFDSTLSTKKYHEHTFDAPPVYDKHSERGGNCRSNMHYSNVAAEIAESRPPNNITIADELLQKRFPRSRQVPPQHPLNYDLAAFQTQSMNASRYYAKQNKRGSASQERNDLRGSETYSMNTPPFQAHFSFETHPTDPCSETTFSSTKRGTPGGTSRSLPTDTKESEYRPVDQSYSCEGIRPSKNSQIGNKSQQQDYTSSNQDRLPALSQARTQVVDNKRDEDDFAIRKRKRLAIIKEIREVMDMRRKAVSIEDDDEVRLFSRHLELLNEELDGTSIGSAIQTKPKEENHRTGSAIQSEGKEGYHSFRSAPIQTEGKVENYSTRSAIQTEGNVENNSIRSAPIQTEGNVDNYNIRSAAIHTEGKIENHSIRSAPIHTAGNEENYSIRTAPIHTAGNEENYSIRTAPIQNKGKMEDWSIDEAENIYFPKGTVHDIEKLPEFKDASVKTDIIKIRAPSDLKAGYEFTATVQGNVVQAIVVSTLNIGV